MTEEHISRGLQAQFERHRIVFWYDAKQELREAFDEVSLPDDAGLPENITANESPLFNANLHAEQAQQQRNLAADRQHEPL